MHVGRSWLKISIQKNLPFKDDRIKRMERIAPENMTTFYFILVELILQNATAVGCCLFTEMVF